MGWLTQLVREIHRRSLWQVLGVYLLGSWAAYQAVLALTEGLALPDWLPGVAIAVFVIGMPIVVATAFITEGPPRWRRLPTAEEVGWTETAPARGRLSWRGTLGTGAAVILVLTTSAAGYLAIADGRGSEGTLIGRGELPPDPLLVVADIGSEGAEAGVRMAVTQSLRVALSQGRTFRLMSQSATDAAARRMRRDPSLPVDAATALELAQREGAAGVVVADVAPLGDAFMITLSIRRAADGQDIFHDQAATASAADLPKTLDVLTRRLRRRVGDSRSELWATDPLERVTTSSFEALKLYSEAMRQGCCIGFDQVQSLLEQSLTHDSLFASAHYRLAVGYRNRGMIQATAFHARRAYELSGRLPETERWPLTVMYRETVEHDRRGAIEALRAAGVRYPRNAVVFVNLSDFLMRQGQWAEAAIVADSAVRLMPGHGSARSNLMYAQLALGRLDDAVHTAQQTPTDAPEQGLRFALHLHIGEVTRNFDYARSYLDSLATIPAQADFLYGHQVQFPLIEGRPSDALRVLSERAVSGGGALELALLELRFMNDTAGAVRRVEERLQRLDLSSLPEHQRPYDALSELFALAGHVDRAQEFARLFRSASTWRTPTPGSAALLMAQNRFAEAAAEYRTLSDRESIAECPGTYVFREARAHQLAGRHDAAIRSYEEGIGAIGCSQRDVELGQALIELGGLHEQRGDQAAARRAYTRLVALWHDPDEYTRPYVELVQQRLGALGTDRARDAR